MPEIVLQILKYLFLLILFLFLTRAVKAMYLEIYGPRVAKPAGPAPATGASKAGKPPERMVVTAPDTAPKTFDIADELIIGRGDKCHVVLTDSYSSQVHARVFRRGADLFIEDMGSTNGTYLNRRKVTSPLQINRGDTARIGKTEMEFRR
ncbi:MAG: FHA domain-containing protein [Actinomycetota bacterium]